MSLLCVNLQVQAKDGVIYKTESGINFINGGISEEQATEIRRSAKNFSLQILFTGGAVGGWLTDVSMMILDGNSQTVFWKKISGPMLYIDLPAGDYQVIGRYNGERQSKRLTLTGEKPQRVILNWKDELADQETIIKGEEE
jgi:hypothetical protein